MIGTRRLLPVALLVAVLVAMVAAPVAHPAAHAQAGYKRISGEGSSWSANAIDAMRVNIKQFGITVDYNPSGSSAGRKNFLNGTVDFAASDIPFQFSPEDGSAPENPAPGSYAYIPVTAGGTAFMYNLNINGQRVTNLRLSGTNVAKIFTGVITQWNDQAIAADNPGLTLPARPVVPVVRSDGSGSSAQFTLWMIATQKGIWDTYCQKSGRAPKCGSTSFYPTIPGMIAQSGDVGVAGYVSQGFAEGAIGYVNYSYALNQGFPVAKVLNAAGYYTEPTPENVAVSLLQAKINTDAANPATYLTQDLRGVYTDRDPRNYQLSSYSYFILPTRLGGQFDAEKGRTLGRFTYYAMCQAQQSSASLGYSPLPINLVTASLEQIKKIPGVEVQNINVKDCDNPTFSPDGTNVLAATAPQPQACDKQGTSQCATGTGGLKTVATPTAPPPSGGGQPAPSGGVPVGGGVAPTVTAAPTTGATGGATDAPATGADTSGGVTSGSPADPNAAVTSDPAQLAGSGADCDPDTGVCGPGAVAQQSGGAAVAQVGVITPTTLAQDSGWGAQETLILLVVLCTLALVLVPAYAWRRAAQPVSPNARQPVAADDRVAA
jgi:phosphate transport system substrate-binding protein